MNVIHPSSRSIFVVLLALSTLLLIGCEPSSGGLLDASDAASMSDSNGPEDTGATDPDMGASDTSTPNPDTSTPNPDTSTPDTSAPDTSAPDTSAPDTSTPAGSLEFVHFGNAYGDGDTYYMLEGMDPSAHAVAVFSELNDTIDLINRSGGDLTIDAITVTPLGDTQAEEFEACATTSSNWLCDPYTLPTLGADERFSFFLQFYPVASDEREAMITINYTDGEGAHSMTLTVRGFGRIGTDDLPAYFLSAGPTLQWHKLWGGFNTNQDEAPGPMAVDGAGNIFFAGNATGHHGPVTGSDRNVFITRVNADGTLGWQKVYHSSSHDEIEQTGDNLQLGAADAMAIDASGDIYLAVRAGNGSNTKNLGLILKLDGETGDEVWSRYWFGDTTRLAFTDSASLFALDVVDGMVYVTGTGKADIDTQGVPVVALTTDGALQWSYLFVPQGAVSSAHRGHTIRADGAGNLYVAGIDYTSGASGGFLARLDVSGATPSLTWSQNFSLGTGSSFVSMDLDANGDVFLAADRRGAPSFFSVVKVASDLSSVEGRTLPGSDGDRNNIYTVRVVGDGVYAGGRIGIPGWDTSNGDGIIARFSSSDLTLDWSGVYYTGNGPDEVCHHSVHGLASSPDGSDIYAVGQVYTGNLNFYRYWGYWYDNPMADEAFNPGFFDTTSSSLLVDMPNAAFVTSADAGFDNDGALDTLSAGANVEFQDAIDKNAETHGSSTDGDVFIMKF